MAPPTPVYSQFDVSSKYKQQLLNPEKYNCKKMSITQHECTFKIKYPSHVPQVICLPFKREFQRCLIPQTRITKGEKVTQDKWVNIEVTDEMTNDELWTDKYDSVVSEFLKADKELKGMFDESRDES